MSNILASRNPYPRSRAIVRSTSGTKYQSSNTLEWTHRPPDDLHSGQVTEGEEEEEEKEEKKKSQKVTRREYSFGEVRAWQRRCRACGEKHGKPRGHTWNNPESHRSSGRSHPDVPWVSSARHRVICGTRVYSFLFIPLFIPCGSSRDTSAHRHEESLVATARMR